jgi:hypothetical protein
MSRLLFSSIYHHTGRSMPLTPNEPARRPPLSLELSTKRSILPMLIFICLPPSHHELCDLVHDALPEGRANSGHLCDLPCLLHHEAIVDEIGVEWVFTNGRCVNQPSPGSSAHRRLRVLAAPPRLG